MTTTAISRSPVPQRFGASPYPLLRRFSVAEYQRMIDVGILGEDDPVELLEEWIVQKMPRDPAHGGTIDLVIQRLNKLVPQGWYVRGQNSMTTADSQPEPDITIVRGNPRDYMRRHPGPADVGLVIEIANTSLERDLADKQRIYARAKVAEYWVIDLANRRVVVFSNPSGATKQPRYRQSVEFAADATTTIPLKLDGKTVGDIHPAELF